MEIRELTENDLPSLLELQEKRLISFTKIWALPAKQKKLLICGYDNLRM